MNTISNTFGKILFLVLCLIQTAHADFKDSVFFLGFGGAGFGSTTVRDEKTSPRLGFFSIGAAAYVRPLGQFLVLGVNSDYRIINQYTEPSKSGGNYRGTRWNILSPSIGIDLGSFLATVDVQTLGDYILKSETENKSQITFTRPLGARARLVYVLSNSVFFGGQYEYVIHTTATDSKQPNERKLEKRQDFWQMGVVFGYLFEFI